MITRAAGWTILIPVKATTRGKSRILVPPSARQRLALAMALDTAAAAAQVGDVLAVVEDAADAAAVGALDRVLVHQTGVTGLNESIVDGLAWLTTGRAGSRTPATGPVAVLPGDLPGLQPHDLVDALALADGLGFAMVADHQGVGTTLLTAAEPGGLQPRYGPDSRLRHLEAGAVQIDLPAGSSVRWDVDTVEDLGSAVGPRTRAVLDGIASRKST